MMPISVTTSLDKVAESIVHEHTRGWLNTADVIEFILEIDTQIADTEFSRVLIAGLQGSLDSEEGA